MSLQFQPTSVTTQPLVVDPITVVNRPPSGSHSDGSFGTVFIILAVIVVISAAACCLGRFCNKYHHKDPKPSKQKQHSIPPKENDDIEFGFDKKMRFPSVRSARHGEFRGLKPSLDTGFKNESKAAVVGEPRGAPILHVG